MCVCVFPRSGALNVCCMTVCLGCSGRLRDLWRAALGETDDTSFSFFKTMGKFPDSQYAITVPCLRSRVFACVFTFVLASGCSCEYVCVRMCVSV